MKTCVRNLMIGLLTATVATSSGLAWAKPPFPFPKYPLHIPMPKPYFPPPIPIIVTPYPKPIFVNPVPVVYPVSTVVVDASNPAPAAYIRLVNPAETGATLKFRLDDGMVRALSAGQSMIIRQVVTVKFDRGGGGGLASYSLTDGTYKFAATQGTWSLFHESDVSSNLVAEDAANPAPRP